MLKNSSAGRCASNRVTSNPKSRAQKTQHKCSSKVLQPKAGSHYKQFFLVSLYLSSLTQLASVYSSSRTQLVGRRGNCACRSCHDIEHLAVWSSGMILAQGARVLGSIPRTALCRCLSTVQGQRWLLCGGTVDMLAQQGAWFCRAGQCSRLPVSFQHVIVEISNKTS